MLLLGLSGCGEVNSTQTQPADKTATASQRPKKNSRGNIVKHVGEEAGVTGEDGKDVVSWTVTGINPNPQCTESYQAPVKNGHLIALDVTVSTTPKLKNSEYNPFSIGSGSLWKYIQKDGTLWNGDLLNDSTVSCIPRTELTDRYWSGRQSTGESHTQRTCYGRILGILSDGHGRMGVSAPMKFGMRTPSPRRSLKARTTGRWKRQAKRPSSPATGGRAWSGYGTPGKPSTTRSTGRPRSAFGICSSKADGRPRFGVAFLFADTFVTQISHKIVFRASIPSNGKAPQPLWL